METPLFRIKVDNKGRVRVYIVDKARDLLCRHYDEVLQELGATKENPWLPSGAKYTEIKLEKDGKGDLREPAKPNSLCGCKSTRKRDSSRDKA